MTGLPERLAALSGWRRALVAALLGVLLAAALPPFYVLPAAPVALTGFVWLLDGARGVRRALLDGWLFGAGFSAAGLYWIANALLIDADRFGWMVPFALLLIAAGFGLFPALVAGATRLVPAGAARYVAFAALWIVVEWLKSWIFTGFPWNPLGSAFALSTALLQPAALGGPWLLSALLLAAALAPAFAALAPVERRRRALGSGLVVAVGIVGLQAGAGAWRLAAHPPGFTGVVVRIVQPSIDQRDKWRADLRNSHFATHIALSLSQSAVAPAAIVWPEAAIPLALLADPERRAEAGSTLAGDALLLAGAVRADRDAAGNLRPWNSLVAIDGRGDLVAAYDKQHLVPFGEYMPLRGLLPFDKLTPGTVDFAAGDGEGVLALGKVPPFRALVCYEAIFPAEVDRGGPRPAWLLNVTNDGWYGVSTGPYQHFEAARLRAVEQGLPLVRAANNGISGLVDPLGRVLAMLPQDAVGYLDVDLPAPLAVAPPYARWGDLTLIPLLVAALAIVAWQLRWPTGGRRARG